MDFLFADKPGGITTHTSDSGESAAFKEHLEAKLGRELFVVHRLDRETTGAMVFPKTLAAAQALTEKFKNREMQKIYWLITDRAVSANSFQVSSLIEKHGKSYVSHASTVDEANATTEFTRLTSVGRFSLWQAKPATGKPHQIRLHARDLGMPILGDERYGGTPFATLCLHAHSLAFSLDGHEYKNSSPPPAYFEDLELLSDTNLVRWLAQMDRRDRLSRSLAGVFPNVHDSSCTIRWIHTEGDPLRVDQFGTVVQFSWYGKDEPSDRELQSIAKLAEIRRWPNWYLQIRTNRGKSPHNEKLIMSDPAPPLRWTAREGELEYEFRRDSGLSPGLFLDQRQNRSWVQRQANGRKVLNLFSYTGGFSLAAAVGGAEQVVTVDLSRSFLEWSKANFGLNRIDVAAAPKGKYEFRDMDSIRYLDWAIGKKIKFDLVICDPPSFSRSGSSVFQIEKILPELIEKLVAVTAPSGQVLFCTNYEQWTLEDLAAKLSPKYEIHPTPKPDWDYELPTVPNLMKSILIK